MTILFSVSFYSSDSAKRIAVLFCACRYLVQMYIKSVRIGTAQYDNPKDVVIFLVLF